MNPKPGIVASLIEHILRPRVPDEVSFIACRPKKAGDILEVEGSISLPVHKEAVTLKFYWLKLMFVKITVLVPVVLLVSFCH